MPPRTTPALTRLDRVIARLESGLGDGPARLRGLIGGASGLVLARLIARTGRPIAVVVRDGLRAALLADAIGAFLGEPDAAIAYPAYPHLPFQGMSPPHRIVAERMGVLARLASGDPPKALVIPARALGDRLPPRELLREQLQTLAVGDIVAREDFIAALVRGGYARVPQVDDVGAFAVRGDLIDVFPPGLPDPLRLSFFDDELETIRPFDPQTQRGRSEAAALEGCTIGPVRDLFLTEATLDWARAGLQAIGDRRGTPSSRLRTILEDLESGIIAIGMEDLLPVFYPQVDSLFDYLEGAPWVWVRDEAEAVHGRLLERWQDLETRAAKAAEAPGEPVLPAEAGYLPAPELTEALSSRAALDLTRHLSFDGTDETPHPELPTRDLADLRAAIEEAMREGELEVLGPFVERVRRWHRQGARVIVCAGSLGALERVRSVLSAYPLRVIPHPLGTPLPEVIAAPDAPDGRPLPTVHAVVAHAGEGFDWSEDGLVLIDHTELFGKPPKARRRIRRPPAELALQSWRDLKVGDLVVHLERGVGRYLGLDAYESPTPARDAHLPPLLRTEPAQSTGGGIRSDLIVLEYAGGDRLYVPVEKLHLVSKHQGGADAPTLDRLGGQGWQKTKSRVTRAVRDIAEKLIRLHAEREARRGHAFNRPEDLYRRFEASFPYDETPDQQKAIEAVLEDLCRERPMDRLVCGDVGFGKTEVAIRAAMKVVIDGWQVAVVVPTQVLAEQHRRSFMQRLEGFPVLVEALTGGQRAASQRELVERIERGGVDIVIGTHRLLSKDIRFKRLGLLIIDEEHRFGVAQKERLRELRPTVDVLTLTATPIPRTLHMSMVGLRDISLIQTPPTDRLPVTTFIAQPTDEVIGEAIRRELLRGGQVFFVHHRVSDIERYAEIIAGLVPEARVAIGHGQMPPGALDKVMARFVSGQANVLVATTIIESGIDISSANTIIIHRADCFGLAQLHQLRGRVGRSDVRAYCYLLVPSMETLAGDAEQRLLAIQRYSDLGSGFSIASHDLDLRGAGDILGADQAGNINAVGFEAYTELLHEAIAELRADSSADDRDTFRADPELRLSVEARIPEAWLPDVQLRLRLYRAFANADDDEELQSLLGAAIDRYGPAPEPVEALADIMRLKLLARRLRLRSVRLSPAGLALGVSGQAPLGPAVLAALVTTDPDASLSPDGTLRLPIPEGSEVSGRASIATAIEALLRLDRFAKAPLPKPELPRAPAQSRQRGPDDASTERTHGSERGSPDRERGRLRQGREPEPRPRGRRVVDVEPDPRRARRRRTDPGRRNE